MTTLSLALPPDVMDELVERVARRTAELLDEHPSEDRWLTTKDAAEYLGMTPNALHKLTAARQIPFEQEVRGGKCWFRRSELDTWREGR